MIYPFLSPCRHDFYPFRAISQQHGREPMCSPPLMPPFRCLLHLPDPSFPFLPSTLDPPLPLLQPPLIPFFLPSAHLWSPFPHHPMLWSLHSPSCDAPVCELPVQEAACVVAPGQRWHRPAGMRGNRVWAFLYKRTIKPTAVHNELILIQVRCTSCILAFWLLSFLLIIDYTVYLCFWATLFICSPLCSTCCGLMCISAAVCMQC